MIRVRIQYDKYNRVFKLLDNKFGPLLDDGDVSELPVSLIIAEPDKDAALARILMSEENRVHEGGPVGKRPPNTRRPDVATRM